MEYCHNCKENTYFKDGFYERTHVIDESPWVLKNSSNGGHEWGKNVRTEKVSGSFCTKCGNESKFNELIKKE